MTPGSWRIRIRGARPVRDVLGVLLVVVTALLYVAERPGVGAAEALAEKGPAVVLESTHDCDFLSAPAVLETATTVRMLGTDHQG